jgi:hypothetical protein
MQTLDIIAIIGFIVVGLIALEILGDPRFREGFVSLSPATFEKENNVPAHLLKDKISVARPHNLFGTLTSQKCFEQDGERLIEKVGNYSQRTNNYKHTYPDSCSAPFHELVGSFYAPREGAIGSPIPKDYTIKHITECSINK